jgi:hypothetical protein
MIYLIKLDREKRETLLAVQIDLTQSKLEGTKMLNRKPGCKAHSIRKQTLRNRRNNII